MGFARAIGGKTMKKSLKTKMLVILSIFFCTLMMFVGSEFVVSYRAAASTPTTFEMVEGALVKNGGQQDSGMSFMVKLTSGSKINGEIRFVIAPINYVKHHDLNKENIFGTSAKYYFDDNVVEGTFNNENKLEIWNVRGKLVESDESYDYYRASVVDFGQNSLSDDDYTKALIREYVGRAYIDDGQDYPFAEYAGGDVANNTRSMAYVADKAIDEGDKVNDGFEGMYLTNGVKNYPFKITYTYNYVGEFSNSKKDSTNIDELADTYTWSAGADIKTEPSDNAGYKYVGAWDTEIEQYTTSKILGGSIGDKTVELTFHTTKSWAVDLSTYNGTFNDIEYNNNYTIPYKGIDSVVFYEDNNANLTLNDAKNIATVSKEGTTIIIVNFSGTGRDAWFTLNATRPTLTVEDEIELFDATKGKYITVGDTVEENDIQEFVSDKFGAVDLSSITTITAESDEATPEKTETGIISYTTDGGLQGVPVNGNSMVKQKVNFETDTVIYQVTVCPATNVITESSQMTSLFNPEVASTASGYYILAKDLDLTSVTKNNKVENKFSGTFDGNGKTIDKATCLLYGLFGTVSGTIKNVAFTNVKLDGVTNWTRTLLGMLENASSLENIYIKLSGTTTPSAEKVRPASVLSNKNISYNVKMNNVVVDSSEFKLTIDSVDKTYTYYSPYGGYTRNTTDASALWKSSGTSYEVNATTLSTLQNNQKNVYFITSDYLYQYKSTADNAASTDVRIIDAHNRKNDTFNPDYVGGVKEENAKIAYVDTFFRYDTADDMTRETSEGEAGDYEAFTNTGFWNWDNENGLVWKGKA